VALSNRLTRILVSIVAIPLIIGVSYYGKIPFLVFVLGIGLIAFHEFAIMVNNKSANVNIKVGLASVFLIITNSYFNYFNFKLLALLIVIIILINELFRNEGSAILNLGTTLTGIFYIGFFAGAIVELRELFNITQSSYTGGGYLIITLFASIWICDSAAYFLGTAFGKHKLFPRVSPKKSWEGAIAGFVFAIVTMIAAKFLGLNILSWKDAIVTGMIVGIIGQIGDLVESLIKRDAGVKDSSSIIPGHGGIFDRFDSLLFTAPAVYLYFTLF